MIEYNGIKFATTDERKAKYDKAWKKVRVSRIIHSKILKLLRRDSNPQLIQKEANQMRGEIVLDHFNTVRLLGWTDQFEEDYYWVYLIRDREGTPKLSYSSCVGGPIRLKGSLPDFEYQMLDNLAGMNFYDIELGLKLCEEKGVRLK